MGEVYQAKDRKLGRDVEIKKLVLYSRKSCSRSVSGVIAESPHPQILA